MSDKKKAAKHASTDAAKDAPKDAKSVPPAAPLVRRDSRAIAICVTVALLLTGLDLWTKSWAEETLSTARLGDQPEVCAVDEDGFVRGYQRLSGEPISIIENVFELEYAENCGAAFGLLRQAPTLVRRLVFGVAAIAATIVLMWLFVQGRGGPYFAASVPLVISGAIGNFFDRTVQGYVVDFIHFHYEHPILWMDRFDYPTFNVADIAITIGVVLLLIDGMRSDAPKPVPAGAAAAAPAPAADADEEEDDDEGDGKPEGEPKGEPKAESETSAR